MIRGSGKLTVNNSNIFQVAGDIAIESVKKPSNITINNSTVGNNLDYVGIFIDENSDNNEIYINNSQIVGNTYTFANVGSTDKLYIDETSTIKTATGRGRNGDSAIRNGWVSYTGRGILEGSVTINELTNYGNIISEKAVGIDNRSRNKNATINTLNNFGNIEGKTYAIYNSNSSIINTLTNDRGAMKGQWTIYNASSGTINNLTNKNNAKIEGQSHGIYNSGMIENLNNNNASTIVGNSNGIYNSGTIKTLNNSGTIESKNGAAINSNGDITNLNLEQNSQLTSTNGVLINNAGTIGTLKNDTDLNSGTTAIQNSRNITTLTNHKTISGTNNAINHTAGTITTLDNKANAKISGVNQAIVIANGATIKTLNNSGTIESKNVATIDNDGTIATLDNKAGATIQGNQAIANGATITDLNNEAGAKISGVNQAIVIANGATIKTLNNSGTIESKNVATIDNDGTIATLDNKAGATIQGNQAIANGATITDLNNEAGAKISGVNQAIAIANGATIKTLNNSGTIESKNGTAIDNDGTITTLDNKAGAKISGVNQAIAIANGALIATLNNSGTIESKNGTAIDNDGTITTLDNKAGAKISGVNQAIAIANDATIENFTNAGDIDGKISIYNNGTIGTLDNSGNISGDIYNTSPNTLKVLKNSGNISGNIYNTATGVMGADDKDNAIENTNSIKSINNAGTIKAKIYAIKNETGSIKDIVNNGKIIFKDKHGAQIYNNGTATAAISKWHINLNKNAKEFNDITKIDTKNGNEHIVDERIFVGGNNLKGIKFGKEAIELSAGTAGEYKLSALVLKSDNNNWITAINDVTGISDDNKFDEKQGLTCSNLKINSQGILVAECIKSNDDAVISITPKKEKSIQTIAPSLWVSNYIMLSAIRYDIVSNTMSSGIGILKEENDGLHVFAIPYANYIKQDTKFGGSHTDTFGIISGAYKGLNEYGVLGVFVGYEQNDASLPQHISANIDTRYVGGSYYNEFPIYSTMHPYIKAFGSYVNTNPNISLLHNTTDTYLNIYNANLAMGVNVNLDSNIIKPELELEYSIMKLGGINIGKESYSKSTLKIPSVGASLAWTRDYGNNFYSVLQGGVKHLLEDTHKTKLRYDGKYIGEVDGKLSTTYGTAMAGIGYKLNSQTALTLNYQGGFAKDIQSHTGIAKVEYKF